MKAIYKPLGIIFGLLAGQVSKKLFDLVWGLFDAEEPPKATTKETNWPKLLIAAAIQGMILRTVRVIVDRGGAKGFENLTGTWPGDIEPETAQAGKAVRK
jgi:hypothetical protein